MPPIRPLPLAIACSLVALAGCQQGTATASAPSAQCQTLLTQLDTADTTVKEVLSSNAKRSVKTLQASASSGYFKGALTSLPAVCPEKIATPGIAEVQERITQLDEYVKTGRWTGPVV